ncbi:kinase-like domain-containing protein [Mycena galopus ATCC 62051]|nr:kinase-like domain-containing protein [Mycena galopus ATCC 62051]
MTVTQLPLPPKKKLSEAEVKEMRLVLQEIIPECHDFRLVSTNSYGKVYKAHHRTLNRTVAVKLVRCLSKVGDDCSNVYPSDHGGPPKDFTILQTLKHPHILEILEVYRHGTRETTSEFILNSGEYHKQQRATRSCLGLPELVCRDVMYQLSQAMAHIHHLGIVHRNLKLDNIFLTSETGFPLIKVAGFGLAARMPTHRDQNLTEICGSIDYMPPEMLSQSQPGYDYRADSWSVGVILMEMWRRDYPEFNLPPFRWADLRAPGRLSADGMEFLEMIVSPDPILRFTLAGALQLKWLMYHRPMYPNIVYP